MRPWSARFYRPLSAAWRKLSLVQQFLALTTLAVVANMLAIGYWAEERIFENAVATMAETNALYLDGALSPHVQGLATSPKLTEEQKRRIDELAHNTQLAARVDLIKIWTLNGDLVYSTDDPAGLRPTPAETPKAALLQAAKGEVAVDFQGHGDGWMLAHPKRVEIYAPIYRAGSGAPVAVGEFYENIEFLENTIAHHRATMWLSVLVFTLLIIGFIYVIVAHANRTILRQQQQLRTHLQTASRLARRNDRLRRIADKARLNAAIANESYLAGIGADLHDGPVQVLGLAMLKLDDSPASEPELALWRESVIGLVRQATQELRAMASGLVLPEIATATLEETIGLALARHEKLTETAVQREIGPLPEEASAALKLCAYRVVQECLSNSFRHAAGRGQSVFARMSGDFLEIVVKDLGGVDWNPDEERVSLGVRGLANRVKALRGALTITTKHGVGTEVRVRIPLQANLAP